MNEQQKRRLIELRAVENELNRQMGRIGKQIHELNKEKAKLAKQISHNMKYRNKIINGL